MFGTFCGLASAVLYTTTNGFLRAVTDCDPVWVSAVKTVPTALFMLPWMLSMHSRGLRAIPPWHVLGVIAVGGVIGQVGGNVPFQWALGTIGVALTVPLTLAGMIVFGTLLGRIFLHEPVTPRTVVALVVLLLATCVLSLGAQTAHDSVHHASSGTHLSDEGAIIGHPGNDTQTSPAHPLELVGAVSAACLSGLAYAVLNVINRYYVTRGHSLPAMLCTVSIMGMLSLGGISLARIGPAEMSATQWSDLRLMLLAGVCNAAAFVALTKSLELTSVIYVNALNATQTTMAAVAGVFFFQEPLSPWLLTGISLTIAGLLLIRKANQRGAENPVAEIQDEP